MNNEKIMKLVAMANALTASASALANAILALGEDERRLIAIKALASPQSTKRTAKAQAPKAKKQKRRVKRAKKVAEEAKAEATEAK